MHGCLVSSLAGLAKTTRFSCDARTQSSEVYLWHEKTAVWSLSFLNWFDLRAN